MAPLSGDQDFLYPLLSIVLLGRGAKWMRHRIMQIVSKGTQLLSDKFSILRPRSHIFRSVRLKSSWPQEALR